MTALDALRDQLAGEAKKLPESLEGAKNASRELVDSINKAFDDALSNATTFSDKAEEISRAEILPSEFTGIVHNYQFGMVNGKPMHRFDMEIQGTGLWLFCMFTSTELDELLLTADPVIDRFVPETIEGMKVTVRRDAKLGRVVPIRFGDIKATTISPVLLQDKDGKDVREGDEVSIRIGGYYDRSFRAFIVGYTKSTKTIEYKPKRGKGTKKIKVANLSRFVRIGDDPVAVGTDSVKLGVDQNGIDVFLGDFLQLYDQSNGKIGGIVTGYDEETFLVKRVDKERGTGADATWRVNSIYVKKLERTPLGVVDSKGNALSIGDTVQFRSNPPSFILEVNTTNQPGRPFVELAGTDARYCDDLVKLDDPA